MSLPVILFFPLHLSEYFSLIWFVINLALFIVSVLCYNMPSKVLNLRKMPCIYYIAAFGIIMELACIAQIVTGGIVTLWNCGKASNRKTSTFLNFYQQSNSKNVLHGTQFYSKEHSSVVKKVNNFIEGRWSHSRIHALLLRSVQL